MLIPSDNKQTENESSNFVIFFHLLQFLFIFRLRVSREILLWKKFWYRIDKDYLNWGWWWKSSRLIQSSSFTFRFSNPRPSQKVFNSYLVIYWIFKYTRNFNFRHRWILKSRKKKYTQPLNKIFSTQFDVLFVTLILFLTKVINIYKESCEFIFLLFGYSNSIKNVQFMMKITMQNKTGKNQCERHS